MTSPVGLVVKVLKAREADFERGLAELPETALDTLSGGGSYTAFLGEGTFFMYLDAGPDDVMARLTEPEETREFRELLDRCTSFDPGTPDRSLAIDVHHVQDLPRTNHAEGEGNM